MDTSTLLATFAQSAAAIVAIIGGFLVSRLVAISSERETIKRQLKAMREEKDHLEKEWQPAHDYRLENSVSKFEEWALETLLEDLEIINDLETDTLLERIPRGSSEEEMRPYAEKLHGRVISALKLLIDKLQDGDNKALSLEDLQDRGLVYKDKDQDLFYEIFHALREKLPDVYHEFGPGMRMKDTTANLSFAPIQPAWIQETNMRRLDESIQEESRLRSELDIAIQTVARLEHDLSVFAQPAGVLAALAILAFFSLLGIVAPLAVMAFGPESPDTWIIVLLFVAFIAGLSSVLGYIGWYFKKIRD